MQTSPVVPSVVSRLSQTCGVPFVTAQTVANGSQGGMQNLVSVMYPGSISAHACPGHSELWWQKRRPGADTGPEAMDDLAGGALRGVVDGVLGPCPHHGDRLGHARQRSGGIELGAGDGDVDEAIPARATAGPGAPPPATRVGTVRSPCV